MATADYQKIAAEYAPPRLVRELAFELSRAWADGYREGRNDMAADERVIVKYDSETEANQ